MTARPESPGAPPVVTVFGASRSVPGDPEYEEGVRCGRLLAEAGFAVATGGYGGLMQAVSEGASGAGGRVIGVTAPAVFHARTGANPHVTEELRAESLTERIHELTRIASAAIALPGSLGTLTELMVAWNLAYVARFSGSEPAPVVTVGASWQELVDLLGREIRTDRSLVTSVDTVDEAVAAVVAALG